MARIPYSDMTGLSPELVEALGKRRNSNVHRMLANCQSSALGYLRMSDEIRFNAILDPAIRELIVLRVGTLCNSDYELHYHKLAARGLDMPEDKIQAIIDQGSGADLLTPKEKAILTFTEEVVADGKASAAAFSALAEYMKPDEMIEATILIGFYIMTSAFLQTFDIQIEDA